MHCDISIIGGGLVGSLAALAIAKQGYRVALIDTTPLQALADLPNLRVSALQPATLNLLNRLGVLEKLDANRMTEIIAIKVYETLDESLDFYASEVGRSHLGVILENEMLLQTIRALYPENIQRVNAECAAIQRIEKHGFELTLSNSSTLSTQFVILAQGGNDLSLAAGLGIRFNTFDHQQEALVMHVESTLPHHHTAYQRFLPGGPLAFLPLFHEHWSSIVWSLPCSDAIHLKKLDPADLARELQNNFPALGNLRIISKIASFPIYAQEADRIAGPGFALMGDIAHMVHPLAGQGVNLGFRDLAAFIRALQHSTARALSLTDPQLIEEYRKATMRSNRIFGRGFSLIDYFYKTPELARLRKIGSRVLSRFMPLKKELMKLAMGDEIV